MSFDEVINNRYACRKFDEYKNIDDELINKILKAGRIAPSAKNFQPTKVYVIKSSESLALIDKCSPCRYGAPVVLMVCGDKSIAWNNGEYSSYEMDASIFATHMILEATNLGLNSVWVRMFDVDTVKTLFKLNDNIIPVCLIPIGYKSIDSPSSLNHEKRKDLSEIVTFM